MMGCFGYLFCHTLKNRVKIAMRRPATYIFGILILGYLFLMLSGIGAIFQDMGADSPEGLAVLLSCIILLILPSNIVAYSKRKGLLFRPADVHLMFPAPLSPKAILLFVGIRNLVINLVLGILIVAGGLLYCHAALWQVASFFVVFAVLENLLEGSMMILCYGNERLSERFFRALTVAVYAMMGVFVLVGALVFAKEQSASAVGAFLSHPAVQMVPAVGWNIAWVRLIFVGPTPVNVACSLLYLVMTLTLLLLSCRCRCVGEYYEDAAKFADDYVKLKAAKAKGQAVNIFRMGKQKKFRKATVEYRGGYAQAIFYRQLLEYKKTPFFIFGFHTVVSLVVGIGMPVFFSLMDMEVEREARLFLVPGVMAYVIFIFSGYSTKWSRELENPYTYLIPDSVFRKIWHSTKIEHIRFVIDGLIMAVPGSVVLGLHPLQIAMIVLFYVCLQANKLYYFMLADLIVGSSLGNIGRSVVKLFLQMVAIGIAAAIGAGFGIFMGVNAGFAAMVFATFLVTLAGAALAAMNFEKMEVMN